MKTPTEVQLAWEILDLIQTLADLIWEHYQEDFRKDIKEHEQRNTKQPWKD